MNIIMMVIVMTTKLQTKFGTATLCNDGYYHISSRKEGNNGKLLHRLIFEDYYQIKLTTNDFIHHEDGDKTNNEMWNLVPMTNGEHTTLHRLNVDRPFHEKVCVSKGHNNTGIFRVSKIKNKVYTNGFTWRYQYYVEGEQKSIVSVDINKLKDKVVENGLEWIILDEDKAKECGLKL